MKATPWHGLLFAKKRLLLAHMHNEAKIRVTNEISKLDVALCHLIDSVHIVVRIFLTHFSLLLFKISMNHVSVGPTI